LRKKPDHHHARFAVLVTESTIEDPGQGAHAMFLEEITEVADEVCSFGSSSGSFDPSIGFLRWASAARRSQGRDRGSTGLCNCPASVPSTEPCILLR
jgi:hypothetical protein